MHHYFDLNKSAKDKIKKEILFSCITLLNQIQKSPFYLERYEIILPNMFSRTLGRALQIL